MSPFLYHSMFFFKKKDWFSDDLLFLFRSLEQNGDPTTATGGGGGPRSWKGNTQKFPLNASWADLINHCQTEHTKACEDMEKLSPSQLAEMKQRTR